MNHSFTLVIKPHARRTVLEDMRTIYSGHTCLVAKNSKYKGLYLHPSAKIIKGSFYKNAGSNKYPILSAKTEVHIQVINFPHKANIVTDSYSKLDNISIIHKV